jgi:hypothetical protein
MLKTNPLAFDVGWEGRNFSIVLFWLLGKFDGINAIMWPTRRSFELGFKVYAIAILVRKSLAIANKFSTGMLRPHKFF